MSSNGMKQGTHKHQLATSLRQADKIFIWRNQNVQWNVTEHLQTDTLKNKLHIYQDIDLVMLSNGTFGGLAAKLIKQLDSQHQKITTKE